jgi:hypothetical protein
VKFIRISADIPRLSKNYRISTKGKGERAKGEKKTFFSIHPSPLSPLSHWFSGDVAGKGFFYFYKILRRSFSAIRRRRLRTNRLDRGSGLPRGVQWQGRGDSNSQPLVLETSALPIELHPCRVCGRKMRNLSQLPAALHIKNYLRILVTTPEPTVRPPSRMAKRTLASMAIGEPNSTLSFTLSPGMHISAPPNKCAEPVTSVVRK